MALMSKLRFVIVGYCNPVANAAAPPKGTAGSAQGNDSSQQSQQHHEDHVLAHKVDKSNLLLHGSITEITSFVELYMTLLNQ